MVPSSDAVGMPAAAASFTHRKNTTPRSFTSLLTAPDTQDAYNVRLRQCSFHWLGILVERGAYCGDNRRQAVRHRGNRAKDSARAGITLQEETIAAKDKPDRFNRDETLMGAGTA